MSTSRMRPSPATVIALIALFVALANTAAGQVDRRGPNPSTSAIPPNSIGAKQLKANSVVASKIKPSAVTTEKIKPESITPLTIAPNAVTAPKLGPAAVTAPKIEPAAIGPEQLGPESVTAAKIKPDAIGSEHVQPDAITAAKIKPESIDTSKIKPQAITPATIAPNAITPAALAPDSVTAPSIAPTAVTGPKIQPNAVSALQLANESVGVSQLSTAIPSASARSTTPTCRSTNTLAGNHYTSELFDTANMFPGGGGADYRLTAPIKGIYQVTATQIWAADNSGGTRSIEFDGREADNATPFGPLGYSTVPAVSGGAVETPQTLTGTYQLNAGQSIEVWTGANGLAGSTSSCGATQTSFGNTGARTSTFTMTFLNPVP